jgi:beta-glucosidase/6-phospho-beta-glucosidase/beta-galactosidase
MFEQFVRLGFDAFRVHVWDREISDKEGKLLDNEHLDLFDYLLSKLEENNITIIITPIAWWGNGWPEPDTKVP